MGGYVISSNQEVIKNMAKQFRLRARRLRRNASITIAFIGFLLVGGIGIFGYAGEIARVEAERAERDATINRVGKQLLEEMVRLTADLVQERTDIENVKKPNVSELQTIAGNLEATALIIKSINEQPIPERNQTSFLISTVTTRVGIVVLLLFLVQILVPLYRYNTKLAGFYDARADALELVDNDNSDGLDRLVTILSPDTLDFGKAPATPTQQALDAAKEVIASQKKV
jgi:hypothetical protein